MSWSELLVSAIMVGQQRKLLGFQPFKTVRFEFLSVTPRTFLLDKSLKVTQIYFYSQTQIFNLSLKHI